MRRTAIALAISSILASAQAADPDAVDIFSGPWQPMAGSPPVAAVERDGARALRMPCAFEGNPVERASWDLAVRLDLSGARGVGLRCLCPDPGPVSHFSIYFESGGGWYAFTFSPPAAAWGTVAIDKENAVVEGSPAGWGKIRTIRISAWRGGETRTDLFIAGLRAEGRDAPIAVILGSSVARAAPEERESVRTYTGSVARCLKDLGFPHVVIADDDITPASLEGRKLVILPHNPSMPDASVRAVAGFIAAGGKLISFYGIPAPIAAAAGVEIGAHVKERAPGQFSSMRFAAPLPAGMPENVPQRSWNILDARPAPGRGRIAASWHDGDGRPTGHAAVIATDAGFHVTHVLIPEDPEAKRHMVAAMAGHLVSGLWAEASRAAIAGSGRIGPYPDFEEARRAIAGDAAGDPGALAALETAGKLRAEAADLAASGRHPESIEKAGESRKALLDAFCRAQKPLPGEHRAFWCHTAGGAGGLGWDEAVRRLAASGFTAIIPNMLWGGIAHYESEVLPVSPEVRSAGDPLAKCLAACRKHGVRCHVWKVNWNMSGRAPADFAARMKREGRTQVTFDGSPNQRWLCPSHPENRKLELDAMVEVASKYAVDGIHFDYIRYPDRDGCFCPGCRGRFEGAIGRPVARWPADVRGDRGLEARWLDFRRDQITALVAAVSESARKARPGIMISAAVFPNWPVDRDAVGQDWKLWCERGYLDFVCPMDYTADDGAFEGFVRRQVGWAGKVPCYPGIGLSVWSPPDDAVVLIGKIRIARRIGTGGFTVFDYSPPATQSVLPLCGVGITRPR
jgi:hypothetical protein